MTFFGRRCGSIRIFGRTCFGSFSSIPGKIILPELGEKLGAYAQRKLVERKVEIHSNCKVTAVTDREVTLSDGDDGDDQYAGLDRRNLPKLPLGHAALHESSEGRVLVNEYLEVPEWPGVWAFGDCALVPDRKTGKSHPPTAQHALREGKVAAQNILATIRGDQKKPFLFSTLGLLAPIGKRTGVANILRRELFRLHCLVAVADDLLDETASI